VFGLATVSPSRPFILSVGVYKCRYRSVHRVFANWEIFRPDRQLFFPDKCFSFPPRSGPFHSPTEHFSRRQSSPLLCPPFCLLPVPPLREGSQVFPLGTYGKDTNLVLRHGSCESPAGIHPYRFAGGKDVWTCHLQTSSSSIHIAVVVNYICLRRKETHSHMCP